MPDYISPDEDPRRQFQPFTAAQDAVQSQQQPTFGEAVTQAQADMGPTVRPQTMEELVQARVQAANAARKVVNPVSPWVEALAAATHPIGTALVQGRTERDVQRLADQVAAEDFRQKALELSRREARQRLELDKTAKFFAALDNVTKLKDLKLRPKYLDSAARAFGVNIDPAVKAHFLHLAENAPETLQQLRDNLMNIPFNQMTPYFENGGQGLDFFLKSEEGQARERAAGIQAGGPAPGAASQFRAEGIRAGLSAEAIERGAEALTPVPTAGQLMAQIPPAPLGQERTTKIEVGPTLKPTVTATQGPAQDKFWVVGGRVLKLEGNKAVPISGQFADDTIAQTKLDTARQLARAAGTPGTVDYNRALLAELSGGAESLRSRLTRALSQYQRGEIVADADMAGLTPSQLEEGAVGSPNILAGLLGGQLTKENKAEETVGFLQRQQIAVGGPQAMKALDDAVDEFLAVNKKVPFEGLRERIVKTKQWQTLTPAQREYALKRLQKATRK